MFGFGNNTKPHFFYIKSVLHTDGYGNTREGSKRIYFDSIKQLYKSFFEEIPFILFEAKYQRKWIPVIDIDSQANYDLAIEYLENRNTKYAVFESSPGNYWILLDRRSSFKAALACMRAVPGQDDNYTIVSERDRTIPLRWSQKIFRHGHVFTPRLIKLSGSKWIDEFCKKIEATFLDIELRTIRNELARLLCLKAKLYSSCKKETDLVPNAGDKISFYNHFDSLFKAIVLKKIDSGYFVYVTDPLIGEDEDTPALHFVAKGHIVEVLGSELEGLLVSEVRKQRKVGEAIVRDSEKLT